jgi:hypothetical protein
MVTKLFPIAQPNPTVEMEKDWVRIQRRLGIRENSIWEIVDLFRF